MSAYLHVIERLVRIQSYITLKSSYSYITTEIVYTTLFYPIYATKWLKEYTHESI